VQLAVPSPDVAPSAAPALAVISSALAHGGVQGHYRHASATTGTDMAFCVYVPPHAPGALLPVVWYLSCLTAAPQDIADKGEYRAACAELGLILVAPDTSPRGPQVPDDPAEAYDFGIAASFYLNATQPPFAQHYQMERYLTEELPPLIAQHFPADLKRQSILGHSMGGHGALTLALRHPQRYRAVSALAPIVAPSCTPWGMKALRGYLGDDAAAWRAHDATALIADGARVAEILVDQGDADEFMAEQLRPELLRAACARAGIPLTLNLRPGYDHAYGFVSTFLGSQLHWHAQRLR
jgi:S-formylglutathione hydrolase